MPLKVAVVGAGSMGMNHLRVLKDLGEEQVRLVGVAEPQPAARSRASNRFQVQGFSDYREMIAEATPDVVAIVVPTDLHFEVASHALDAGVNVLVEKPITATVAQAEQLIALARERGAHLAVGHVERFNPAVLELKRQLDSGNVGRIFYLHARRLGPFPPRIRDVGVILDLATHDLDVMRYLAGSEVRHVFAETQQRVHQTHEDLLLGLIRFGNAAIGMLDVNWLTPTKIRELTVTGERGMYLVNYLSQDLYFYENDYTATEWDTMRSLTGVSEGTMTRLKVQKSEPLRLEWENVLAAVRDGTDVKVTGEDGLAVLRLAHQLMRAAEKPEVIS
ncbi:MAG TPA: Gfo/Idh/MocA family oxidoreductase [Ktedonobacterales bacterium]|nr:Gfo/Idh/MocA family oxidoreductase [Ktedonobacterales bacterium]